MRRFILALRCLIFGLFIACNAIICSVAVWHFSLAQTISYNPSVDIFLIVLGAFSLLFIFVVQWIDILRKNAITSHVWFECLWVGVFWIMALCGTAVLTASVPIVMCSPEVELVVPQSCTATNVLLAFSWIDMIIMLVYLVALSVLALVHHKKDKAVWHTGIREYAWFGEHQSLHSSPNSPIPGFKTMVLAHPRPVRPVERAMSYAQSERISDDVERQGATLGPPPELPVPPIPAAPPPKHIREDVRQVASTSGAPALYPKHVQANMKPVYTTQTFPESPLSPSPLGEWPRPDILTRPTISRKTKAQAPLSTVTSPPVPSSSIPTAPGQSRHRHARSRSGSGEIHRPPPLDLSGISFFKESGNRDRRG